MRFSKEIILGCRDIGGSFKASGIQQIPKDAELGCGVLTRSAGDFYLKVTCFEDKKLKLKTGKSIGIDFGIESTITTSDGDKILVRLPETKRLKKLSRGIYRKVKGSRNRFKQCIRFQKEYNKLVNRKNDIRNKIVHDLVTKNDVIAIQDDKVEGWKERHGRQVQQSIIGGIISSLKNKPETLVVDRYFPSTQLCGKCGERTIHGEKERIFVCGFCGETEDRDIHAAKNILREAIGIRNSLLRGVGDLKTSVEFQPLFSSDTEQVGMLKQEAIAL